MVHKDYRLELGLVSPRKYVPRSVAIIVLICVAATLSWTASVLVAEGKKRHAHAKPQAAAPAAATQAATQ